MPGRNEPCWCGSGRKYKQCHRLYDEALPARKYQAAQEVYAKLWDATSRHHFESGVYHWLAEQLRPLAPKRILDIGCGTGQSLVAIHEVLAEGVKVVAIDENLACLERAATVRARHGVDCRVERRFFAVRLTGHGYDYDVSPMTVEHGATDLLIEADVTNDPFLERALKESGSFDAVTVWLTGTHVARPHHVAVRRAGVSSDAEHRLFVQNAVYELADDVLRSGGWLHVCDREQTPTNDGLVEEVLDAHRDQASVTSLVVQGLEHRPYEQPGGVPMVVSPGTSGRLPERLDTSFVVVRSEKLPAAWAGS